MSEQQHTSKPWEHAKTGGSEVDPLAVRMVASLHVDQRLYLYDITGSIAHAKMLEAVGLISHDERKEIVTGLMQIKAEIERDGPDWPGWKLELEDVHMCIEAALIDKIGEAGRKLHTGRSRNDQVALDLHLWCHDAAAKLSDACRELTLAFVELAERDGRIVMPAYTHLQRAQPIVAGAELLAWACAVERGRRRINVLDQLHDQCPLGSGAIAGSCLPLDRELVCELLENKAGAVPAANSIDATASRDIAIDLIYAMTMIMTTLSRFAEQWIIYMTSEFGFITIGQAYTTGSSMMPQKRNPDMLELIRGRSGTLLGHLIALIAICKGITVGYNRDLQEDKRHLFCAFDTTIDCVDIAAAIVRSAKFQTEKIARSLDKGFLDATVLAEYLVTKGLPFRTAHQVVGRLVRACEQTGLSKLGDLSLDQMNAAIGGGDVLFDSDVYNWLGPINVVRRIQTTGGAGLGPFEEQLTKWKQYLQK